MPGFMCCSKQSTEDWVEPICGPIGLFIVKVLHRIEYYTGLQNILSPVLFFFAVVQAYTGMRYYPFPDGSIELLQSGNDTLFLKVQDRVLDIARSMASHGALRPSSDLEMRSVDCWMRALPEPQGDFPGTLRCYRAHASDQAILF